jgi:hypothetical protein
LLKGSFSEEEAEDVVIEIVQCEVPLETRVAQRFDLICELGVGISIYNRNLVPFDVSIQIVVRVIHRRSIPFISDARVLHLDACWWLKVNVLRHFFKE